MGFADLGESPAAHGRAVYEMNCAPCHGTSGQGGYLGPSARPPHISGARVDKIVRQVRAGGKVMPAFSSAMLPDTALHDLAAYVHQGVGSTAQEPSHVGPRQVDPFLMGLFVCGALAVLALAIAMLFGEGRN